MSAPLYAAVDVLLPLRDAWIAEHPEHAACLRCSHRKLLHCADGTGCVGPIGALGCRCSHFCSSWVNETPGEHWR